MWWDWNILGHIFRPNQDVWTEKKFSIFYPKIEFSSSNIEDFGHFWQFLGVLGRRTRVTDLRWKFSCFVSIKGLLRFNIVPYGTLTIIGFPETTLLVVENRLRKVWGRFSTLRGGPNFFIMHIFFALNLLYKIPEGISDRTKNVTCERFLARKSRFCKNRYHRRSKIRSELSIHTFVRYVSG